MKFLGINFATADYAIFLLPILIICFVILIYKNRKTHKIVSLLTYKFKNNNNLHNFSLNKKYIRSVLFFLGLIFIFLALLSPQWNEKEEVIKQHSRDILIALDISKSMLAKDLKPNRIEWAKNKIKSLLKLIKTDRVGLILFSGSAFIQCPLTKDFDTFYMFLDQVDVETISNGTTSIDQPIKLALEALQPSANKKNKILVIFTDGEDFSSNLSELKQRAQKENLHIFSVGIGTTEGAPIPLYDISGKQIGHQMDKKGSIVISKLNESILNNLSQESGAFYTKTTQNNNDMKTILNKILNFEAEQFDDKRMNNLQEQYSYFAAISFLCFALEWIL